MKCPRVWQRGAGTWDENLLEAPPTVQKIYGASEKRLDKKINNSKD